MAKNTNSDEARSQFLGGSDVAGILGLSPWATPLDIYYRKVGYPIGSTGVDPMRAKILRRGKLMEPVVVSMVAAELPIRILKRSSDRKPNRYRDAKFPFLAAEIDFEWLGTPEMLAAYPAIPLDTGRLNGEVKTSSPFAASVYGLEGTDELPIAYACQAMHGLGVTDREACLVPVLVGSDNLTLFHVLRNDELIKVMREKCEKFWVDHVLKRVPPDAVNVADVHRILRVRNDITVQADADLIAAVERLRAARDAEKEAEAKAEAAQFAVIRHLVSEDAIEHPTAEGRHVVMSGKDQLLTMTLQSRDSVQAKALKEKHPEVYKEYCKTSSFFVCRLSKTK